MDALNLRVKKVAAYVGSLVIVTTIVASGLSWAAWQLLFAKE
mgnify:CR=1 FL=1